MGKLKPNTRAIWAVKMPTARRPLSNRGEHHECALYLDLENIEHTKTKSPQTNGICERFHQTIQNEFHATAFRRKLYHSLDALQTDMSMNGSDGTMKRVRMPVSIALARPLYGPLSIANILPSISS